MIIGTLFWVLSVITLALLIVFIIGWAKKETDWMIFGGLSLLFVGIIGWGALGGLPAQEVSRTKIRDFQSYESQGFLFIQYNSDYSVIYDARDAYNIKTTKTIDWVEWRNLYNGSPTFRIEAPK